MAGRVCDAEGDRGMALRERIEVLTAERSKGDFGLAAGRPDQRFSRGAGLDRSEFVALEGVGGLMSGLLEVGVSVVELVLEGRWTKADTDQGFLPRRVSRETVGRTTPTLTSVQRALRGTRTLMASRKGASRLSQRRACRATSSSRRAGALPRGAPVA